MGYAWKQADAGFTLIELVIVIVLLGVLSAYAVSSNLSASTYTVTSQANTLARDLRHAQALALTWSRSVQVTTADGTNGSYSVSCVTSGTSPCNASPVKDPATGGNFSTSVAHGVVLAGPGTALQFDSSGKPSAAVAYTLVGGSLVKTVSVAALTGLVTVTP